MPRYRLLPGQATAKVWQLNGEQLGLCRFPRCNSTTLWAAGVCSQTMARGVRGGAAAHRKAAAARRRRRSAEQVGDRAAQAAEQANAAAGRRHADCAAMSTVYQPQAEAYCS